MVGTLKNSEGDWALIQNKENVIFRVKPGNYMGTNHGQITRITEEQIDLTEIIPDRRGGFIERSATISLGE
jgi:type IV pilus assembly protein PilP